MLQVTKRRRVYHQLVSDYGWDTDIQNASQQTGSAIDMSLDEFMTYALSKVTWSIATEPRDAPGGVQKADLSEAHNLERLVRQVVERLCFLRTFLYRMSISNSDNGQVKVDVQRCRSDITSQHQATLARDLFIVALRWCQKFGPDLTLCMFRLVYCWCLGDCLGTALVLR